MFQVSRMHSLESKVCGKLLLWMKHLTRKEFGTKSIYLNWLKTGIWSAKNHVWYFIVITVCSWHFKSLSKVLLKRFKSFVVSFSCMIHVVSNDFCLLPSSPTTILSLAVEVYGSHRRSNAIECWEVPGVEVLTPTGCINSLLNLLPEEHKNDTMNPCGWMWALIADNFISWNNVLIQLGLFYSFLIKVSWK